MRLLAVAFASLVLGVAYGQVEMEHKIGYPKFQNKKTNLYDVTINVTSGVPGMHPQVSKSVINMELKLYATSASEVLIYMHNVKVSGSKSSVGSSSEPITMQPNTDLEEHLKIPIKAIFEQGIVTSYTLDDHETLESKTLKKTILRHFQVYLDKKALTSGDTHWKTSSYNVTRSSPVGNYSSHYILTSSPYADFPFEKNVINITRTDNYETIPYLAYQSHHNFEQQGCPDVCKSDHVENRFGAGCPAELEPYQTPIKKSLVQHHNLRTSESLGTTIDIIKTKETHVADVYDQNMQVSIETLIRFKKTSSEEISQPGGQTSYSDLNDDSKYINEEEIKKQCSYPEPKEAVAAVKTILTKITDIVLEGSVESEKAKTVGEELILLQKSLSILKLVELKEVQSSIIGYDELSEASEHDKIKRQIWLDSLPIIGSAPSVSFIVKLIRENMNKPSKFISVWEATSILESLPMNIWEPSSKTIEELSGLLEILQERSAPGYSMLYSASHLAVSRVIRNLCAVSSGIPEEEETGKRNYQSQEFMDHSCPKTVVKKYIQDIAQKLKMTTDKTKRVIYIEALARTGHKSVLSYLEPFVHGRFSGHTPSYVDYVRAVTLYALHNVVSKYPTEVQKLILPIFVNKTEPPKVRIGAFGVYARSNPTLGSLQHIAEQTWSEPSEEVGSYVTSTLEYFGNSTIPCHQLTARRIKKVLPQIKRFYNGKHHAQNIMNTMYDDIRGFGLEHRFEVTPSNESFFPSTFYGGIGYNADSLKDIFFQYALNAQGLTSRNLWDTFLKIFGLKPAEEIPKEKESEIFPEMDIVARDQEFWRITVFKKLFYSTSYYYFDAEDSHRGDIFNLIKEQLLHYFKRDVSSGKIVGHLVKVHIPSTYHSKAVSHSLPYPVEFEMKNPTLYSLKLDIDHLPSTNGAGYSINISPSVYHSILHTNQMLNLGDCKTIGVYHEKKWAATYPVKVDLEMEKNGKFHVSYSFPELPKKIYTYSSEAGTYTGKYSLESLPSMQERSTIKTIPSQFVRKNTYGVLGLPPFVSEIHSEDIQHGYEQIPRTYADLVKQISKDFLNAGWRRKTVDISRVADTKTWIPNTEVKLTIDHGRQYVTFDQEPKSEERWEKNIDFDKHDKGKYSSEGRAIHERISTVSHVSDELLISVEHKITGSQVNKGQVHIVHNRTLGGALHFVHAYAKAKVPGMPVAVSTSTDFAAAFINRPNEFKYGDESYGKQKGLILGSVSFGSEKPFDRPAVSFKWLLSHRSLETYLKKEMSSSVSSKYFLPETHEQCTRDVEAGMSQSVDCLKAIRERAIFNHWSIKATWEKELPWLIKAAAHRVDLALKQVLYSHMTSYRKSPTKEFTLESTYIDKLTDKPVVDFLITNPTGVIRYRRVKPSWIQPVSSIYSYEDAYIQAWTNNTYPPSCSLMDKYIRTYDLKTFPMPRDGACTYVLSTHCTEHKKFAILVKINPEEPGTKEIHIYLGRHSIVLVPGNRREYTVKYDGADHKVRALRPIMLHHTEVIYALANKAVDGSYFIEIHAEKAGIKTTYDGKNVKVQVHPRYKGELCGLCSEFNGEIVREMRGPNRCLYSHSDDYAKSCIVGSCEVEREPDHPFICGDDRVSYSWPDHEQHAEGEYKPTLERNHVYEKDNILCFSIKPVPQCNDNDKIVKTAKKHYNYHCLDKGSYWAKKLLEESKTKVIRSLINKRIDWSQYVDYPTLCSH